MSRREESVSAGTRSIAPVTINLLPVFVSGIPTPTIHDSIFGQDAAATVPIIGPGASMPNVSTDAIIIGTNAIVGQAAANAGGIAIGRGAAANAKSKVRIGTDLAFGAGSGDDSVAIGTQVGVGGNASIAIGRGSQAPTNSISIGHTASCNGTTEGIAIGHGATCVNNGVNHISIAIGNGANAGVNNGQSAIAIGYNATANHALGSKLIAIGQGATITSGVAAAICIGSGAGATVQPIANEVIFGDSLNGDHIVIFTLRTLAATGVKHRSGADGSWSIVDLANVNTHFKTDASAVAGDTRMLVWDVTKGALSRVSVGAANSGGAGFKQLLVPN